MKPATEGCGLLRSVFLLVAVYCALFVMGASAAADKQQSQFRIAIIPQYEISRLRDIWKPIISELEKRTGYRFNLIGTPNILGFENALFSGQFDFAYINPYQAMLALENGQYYPLVADLGRKLSGILVVKEDADYTKHSQLQGATIAFPAPNALGATLMMRSALKRVFHLQYSYFYSQNHTSSYLNVVLGRAAAAGGVMSTLKAQPAHIRDQLRVIYRTVGVTPHPIVAHRRLPEAVVQSVREALLDMAAQEDGRDLLLQVPFVRLGAAMPEDFLALKELELEAFHER